MQVAASLVDVERDVKREDSAITSPCADVVRTVDKCCPFRQLPREKFAILLFWYMVAAHITFSYTRTKTTDKTHGAAASEVPGASVSSVAPFGYWYAVVLTLKSVYQASARQAVVSSRAAASAV